jgi:hypothetical protein
MDKMLSCINYIIPLSKLFSIEYAALFDFINPGLCALGLPIALGGSSNHFRGIM